MHLNLLLIHRFKLSSQHGDEFSLVSQFILFFHFIYTVHMTGLLHEGIFHVQGLTKSVTFGSLHRAYITCNWAKILI